MTGNYIYQYTKRMPKPMLESIQWPIDDLPKICMYSPDMDSYSVFYAPDDICKCGNYEWIASALVVNVFENQIAMSPKRFHKCSLCKEVRISRLKGEFEKIISTSKSLLETLLTKMDSDDQCLHILKNMASNLERKIVDKHFEKNKEKILSMKKFCEELKIDQSLVLDMVKNKSQGKVQKNV